MAIDTELTAPRRTIPPGRRTAPGSSVPPRGEMPPHATGQNAAAPGRPLPPGTAPDRTGRKLRIRRKRRVSAPRHTRPVTEPSVGPAGRPATTTASPNGAPIEVPTAVPRGVPTGLQREGSSPSGVPRGLRGDGSPPRGVPRGVWGDGFPPPAGSVGDASPRPARLRHPRAPFILLLVGLLGGALVSLLVISTTLAEGSFTITNLQQQNTRLARQEQLLSQQVAEASSPAQIAQEAAQLGMQQNPELRFIDLKTGKIVSGKVSAADAEIDVPGYTP
jgi:hypothetical protein